MPDQTKILNGKSIVRVCLYAPLPPPYGGISHWTKMVSGYAKNIPDIRVVNINSAPRGRAVYDLNIKFRLLVGFFQLLSEILQLLKYLLMRKIDVVHLTSSGSLSVVRDIVISILVRLFSVNFVYHLRFGRIPKISILNTLEWRCIVSSISRATNTIVLDKDTYAAIKIFAPKANVSLIPNCVDESLFNIHKEFGTKKKVALFVGWVVPSKGITELVEAWSILRPSGWILKIVGPCDKKYQSELLFKFESKNIFFLNELSHPNAMKEVAACDLFVLPSYSEGFPNAVVEAMALGRPIIATSVGAIPEMLSSGAGLIVKPKNVNALMSALNMLIHDPIMRDSMGTQAREKAMSSYSIKAIFDSYVSIWKNAPIAPKI